MLKRTAVIQFMIDNPERFIESITENSWLRYLNNMCIQGTWTDALIIQAVADQLCIKSYKTKLLFVENVYNKDILIVSKIN